MTLNYSKTWKIQT